MKQKYLVLMYQITLVKQNRLQYLLCNLWPQKHDYLGVARKTTL
jgi:hypothetical protein